MNYLQNSENKQTNPCLNSKFEAVFQEPKVSVHEKDGFGFAAESAFPCKGVDFAGESDNEVNVVDHELDHEKTLKL